MSKDIMEELLADPVERRAVEQYEHFFDLERKCVQLRKQQGITQEQLAEMINVDVDTIAHFENSSVVDTRVTVGFLFDYLHALGAKMTFDIEQEDIV